MKMLSWMNFLVRYYVKRYDAELDEVRYQSPLIQKKQLKKILDLPLAKYLNPQIGEQALSVDQWRASAMVTDYDYYKSGIDNLLKAKPIKVEYFAQSSGTTTGQKKLIPTPEYFVRSNHLRGSWYILNILYRYSDTMNVFSSKNLLIGGAIYERNKDYWIGDVSGIMINRIPSFFRPFYVPSISEGVSPEWEQKIEVTARAASKETKISLVGGVPTWVLATFRKIIQYSGAEKISDLWPDVRAYIHGGVSLEPYKSQFLDLIDRSNFLFIEVYNATEGFFAVQDDPDQEGMLLMTKSGIYFEFVPHYLFQKDIKAQDILEISQVNLDTEYVMLISTQTGLLRYLQGDIVKFVSISPYRIKVTGRISEFINAFGEDLMLAQAQEALLKVAAIHNAEVNHYTVGPKYITIDNNGRHDWIIEFETPPQDIASFTRDLDTAIIESNGNYRQKRSGEIALESLQIYVASAGVFEKFLKLKGKLGAQGKIKKLSNDRIIIDEILQLLKKEL